jgi:lipopolysaccharide export system permease protein
LALFLACVFLTSKLAQEFQLTALFGSSVSLYRLLVPYLIVGLSWTGLMLWFNGWVVPEANRVRIEFEQQYFKDRDSDVAVNNLHIQNRPGSIVSVGYYDRRNSIAYRVSLQTFEDSKRLSRRTDARNMSWIDSLKVWRLTDSILRTFDPDGKEHQHRLTRLDTMLNIYPSDLARTDRDTERMTIPEAAAHIETLRRSGASNIGRPLVEYYAKFAYPFASLILILIAMPLAAVRRAGGQAVQLGIGLGIAFFYLVFQKLTEPFGYSGELNPILTVWIPHAMFLLFGILLLKRART